jgi:hypothetical protein
MRNKILKPTPVRVIFGNLSHDIFNTCPSSRQKQLLPLSYRNYTKKRKSESIEILPDIPVALYNHSPTNLNQAFLYNNKKMQHNQDFNYSVPKLNRMLFEATSTEFLKKMQLDDFNAFRVYNNISSADTNKQHRPSIGDFPSRKKPTKIFLKRNSDIGYRSKNANIIENPQGFPSFTKKKIIARKLVSRKPSKAENEQHSVFKKTKSTHISIGWLFTGN